MRKQTKKQKQEAERQLRLNPINNFHCCGKTMPFNEFKEHLVNDHKLSLEQAKGKKQMIAHIDGDYWYSWDYQWELETGLKFTQHTEHARDKDDPMRYDY